MSETKIRVTCEDCGTEQRAKKDGTPYKHACCPVVDEFSAPTPVPAPEILTGDNGAREHTEPVKGPWFGAAYSGECSICLNRIEEGDMIRADGDGGYECEAWCGQDDPVTPAVPELPEISVPTPPVAPQISKYISGRYAIKDPTTGDYRRHKKGTIKGVTRVTTFVKAATDSMALNEWGKRNILIGAAKRPDIVARATGMTHEDHKVQLNQIAGELADVAGAKVSAEYGTTVHKLTEQVDSGQITLAMVPEQYRRAVELYLKCLADNGLQVVPGLIERSVFLEEFGGVAGTFDRIYRDVATDSYVMGDVKSGKTLAYGMNEIEAQLAMYARAFNRHGVYDWTNQVWEPRITGSDGRPVRVNTGIGVVIHMPFQGPDAGTVRAVKAWLTRGWEYAELCGAVRGFEKAKPEPWTPPARPVFGGWEARFSAVQTREEAAELYDKALSVGVNPAILVGYVELARQALMSRP